jgi:hypothetical protein
MQELKALKSGDKLNVSYKGIRPCTFKNLKGKCAFVEFDSGDGTGVRLHRVLATTLLPVAQEKPKGKLVANPDLTKGLNASQLVQLAEALKTLERLGLEVQELI